MFADRIFLDHARAEIEFSGARLLGSSVTAGIGTSDISPKTAYCSVMETSPKLCYNNIAVLLRWPCTIRRVPWKITMSLPVIATKTRGEYRIYWNIHYKDRGLPASAWTCESAVMPLWYEQRRGPFI